MTALLGQNIRHDNRLNHSSVARFSEMVRALNSKVNADPDWFKKTHCRRLVSPLLDSSLFINVKQLWNDDETSELIDKINPKLTSIIETKIPKVNLSNQINQDNIIIDDQQKNSTMILCNSEINNKNSILNETNKEINKIINSKIISETVVNDEIADYCSASVSSIDIDSIKTLSNNLSDKANLNDKKEITQKNNIKKNSTDSSITLSSSSVNDESEKIWQNEVADSGVFTNTFDDETKKHLKNFIIEKLNDQTNTKIQMPLLKNNNNKSK